MNDYEDIINMPHHTSKTRKKMSIYNRAAQFMPFSALTGYDEEIKEKDRKVTSKISLSSDDEVVINNKLNNVIKSITLKPLVKVTYFIDDLYKEGGNYITEVLKLKSIDEANKLLVFSNKKILINNIIDISLYID